MEFVFEESGQFLLGEGQALSFLLPQPGPTVGSHLVRVTMAMINECLPGRAALTIATTELRKVVLAEGKTQFLAESLKVLPPVEALEELLLGQSSFDLTGSVVFHGISPEAEIIP